MKQVAKRKTVFPKLPKTIGVSELRADLAANLAKAKKRPLFISERRGNDSYVILSSDDYNALVEAREDAIDSIELVDLVKREKNAKSIPWESIRPK